MTETRRRTLLVLLFLVVFAFGTFSVSTVGAQVAGPTEHQSDATAGAESHDAGWMPTIAKVFNFAVLVGVLAYFLKSPLTAHLAARHATIRRELVEAQTLRQTAEQQLAAVRARMAELPAELLALDVRGREELALEQTRMKAATVEERDKLVLRARRDIELQFRVARRGLLEHTANLAVQLARRRLELQITPDDQNRLIERYAREVRL